MRRLLTIATAALAAALLLAPAAAQARVGQQGPKRVVDRNRDRIPDSWERRHGLSLRVKQTRRDPDRDGLNNLGEYRAHTNPRDPDTDDDGVKDGAEHAGYVVSFEEGVLTVALYGGGSVTGRVTDHTHVECKKDRQPAPEPVPTLTARASTEDVDEPREDKPKERPREDKPSHDKPRHKCSAADLVPEAVVHEAHLRIGPDGAVFKRVTLVR